MKKITLSIGLLIGILTSNAQDTTCTYFIGERVIEFDYQTSTPLFETIQTSKYYEENYRKKRSTNTNSINICSNVYVELWKYSASPRLWYH